ncbi:RNA-directed DNA polymerase [Brachyspira pilosicoli]|uniref:RNA-directed DNA polymerase n=1 Tax=Brachyspira pilosicoli TaxID=52584 RepID=UPI0012F49951|nr:RNA-directed DNA polymerase [Brachyspira pilosicoli]
MSNIRKEFFNKKVELLSLSSDKIAKWFLYYGYYGDKYKYPPIFDICKFNENMSDFLVYKLNPKDAKKDKTVYELLNLDIRYTNDSKRIFSLIHPNIYHDIVKVIVDNWNTIIEHIFNEDLKIYSYSFPIPIYKTKVQNKSSSKNMIYNFLTVEEKLTNDAYNYKYILRTDISKFYHSIYTHSIAWALEGRENAFLNRNKRDNLGVQLDSLFQRANHFQTNGIPIGSAVSDVVAEIVLSKIDRNVSLESRIKDMDFVATRYKDDYRFLCNTEEEAKYIRDILENELQKYNLWMNKSKTNIFKLPHGLERKWKKAYYKNCILPKFNLKIDDFLTAYYYLIEIEEEYPGSSMISKFLDNLVDKKGHVIFSHLKTKDKIKIINLLSLLIDYSPRILPQIFSIIELLINNISKETEFYLFVEDFINKMYSNLVNSKMIDEYRLIWIYFFSKKHNINLINVTNDKLLYTLNNNKFINYMENRTDIFDNIDIDTNIYNDNNINDFIYNHVSIFKKINIKH